VERSTQQQLAEQIAKLVEAETRSGDIAAIFASIEKINHRLDKLEASAAQPRPDPSIHASQDRFAIAEAIVDELFAAQGAEKACAFEPNDRPCDHCSMCSARGF